MLCAHAHHFLACGLGCGTGLPVYYRSPDLIVGRTADNRPIIPLLIKDGPNEKMGNGNALTYTALPAQLGIAMTFHKSQSKTFDRMIMDLNLRPGSMGRLSYEALLVAYSRVK